MLVTVTLLADCAARLHPVDTRRVVLKYHQRRAIFRNELSRLATLTTIAFDDSSCSGLRPAPDCRPRGTFPHLSYSCASPCGRAMLVTQDPQRTIGVLFCCAAQRRFGRPMMWYVWPLDLRGT
jgi:hypothetical protein